MTPTTAAPLSLEAFLETADLETSSAWEYIDGAAHQKPMPQPHHSRLQLKLATAINHSAESLAIAAAFPELRCTFGGRSLVPDIAVLRWANIPFTPTGELNTAAILTPPDWTIEILSPGQSTTKVMSNILFCLAAGSELGWLIDPGDRAVLTLHPPQQITIYRDDQPLPTLSDLALDLTVNQLFQWLTLGR
ncbi:Uma2 family endonuclease [Spirulina major]|uniref:Uma2 family endonuclease n=1 Tax=Spirulina major TaxID=270636 RepID=UPI0009337437|nr:Uma2 family endonuclease [Spirulina major]